MKIRPGGPLRKHFATISAALVKETVAPAYSPGYKNSLPYPIKENHP